MKGGVPMKDIIINQILPVVIDFTMVVILGVISSVIKNFAKTKSLRVIVDDVVRFVEQTCKESEHGEDKLSLAELQLSAILKDKGITISQEEMSALIESAVYRMNQSITDKIDNRDKTESGGEHNNG